MSWGRIDFGCGLKRLLIRIWILEGGLGAGFWLGSIRVEVRVGLEVVVGKMGRRSRQIPGLWVGENDSKPSMEWGQLV